MNGKGVAISIVFLLLLLPSIRISSADEFSNFPFHQEIKIDVSDGMNQPVDMPLRFAHPCWAEDERNSSVRIVYDDGSGKKEIESQIYNIHHTDTNHIDSCNIVFLLHGKGRYYVYYSDERTSPPRYPDHVSVSDGSYYYEPIPGYAIHMNYYLIEQDGYPVYGIGQDGSFLGIDMAQKVVKQLDGRKEFKVFNWEQVASFAFFWYGGKDEGTDEKLISKKIMVDGNLMVRVGMTSMSSDEKVRTSGVYTYYYCPSKEKRLMEDVKDEALEECRISGMEEDDGLYTYLLTVRCRSSSIPDLNFGYIPPYLHVNAEDGTVHEYKLDQNPENRYENWILSPTDDVDLGNNPWFSIDDGKSGKAHALIFKNTSVSSYQSGIQISATEKQEINIPGLKVDGMGVNGGRNSYEAGGEHSLVIPKGFTAKFSSEFFSSPDGGVASVEKEANMYHSLIPYRAAGGGGGGGNEEHAEKYSLTVFPHLAPSIPFSSALSIITGRELPSLRVELWKNDTLVASSVCSRLPFISGSGGRISFDFRNFTVMKKAVFPDVKQGDYIIKVFRGMSGSGGKYVGAKFVHVDGDKKVHVTCGFEGKVKISVFDQNGNGIENAYAFLEKDGEVYSGNMTDGQGTAVIRAPSPSRYFLKVMYKGFLVYNESIFLPTFFDRKANVEINELHVTVTDRLGFPPGVEIYPFLTSDSMEKKISIRGDEISPGEYVFEGLPSAAYTLHIKYRSFYVSRDVSLPDENDIHVTFPAVYSLKVSALNSRGMRIGRIDMTLKREGMTVKGMEIPPGRYTVMLENGRKTVGEREISVTGDTDINMVTSERPSFPAILSAMIVIFAALAIFIKKPSADQIVMIAVMALLMLSVLYPWWHMEGRGGGMNVYTDVYLIPAKMVTMGRADGFINGEVASMPSIFGAMLNSVAVLTLLAAASVPAFFIFRRRWIAIAIVLTALLAITVFSYGMSQTGDVMTGSLLGSGNISISIPGSGTSSIPCRWSPSGGYYMAIIAVILLILYLVAGGKTAIPKLFARFSR